MLSRYQAIKLPHRPQPITGIFMCVLLLGDRITSSFLFLFGRENRAARRQFVGAVSRLQLPLSIKKRKKSEGLKTISVQVSLYVLCVLSINSQVFFILCRQMFHVEHLFGYSLLPHLPNLPSDRGQTALQYEHCITVALLRIWRHVPTNPGGFIPALTTCASERINPARDLFPA